MSAGRRTGVSTGGSSILVIFVLLCMTTFATLSLVSANADYKLTSKTAEAMSEYYAADASAVEIMAVIRDCLGTARSQSGIDTVKFKQLLSQNGVDAAFDGHEISYGVPVGERQELQVVLRVIQAQNGAGWMLERAQWKVVNISEWQPEDKGFNLWGGDEEFFIY